MRHEFERSCGTALHSGIVLRFTEIPLAMPPEAPLLPRFVAATFRHFCGACFRRLHTTLPWESGPRKPNSHQATSSSALTSPIVMCCCQLMDIVHKRFPRIYPSASLLVRVSPVTGKYCSEVYYLACNILLSVRYSSLLRII